MAAPLTRLIVTDLAFPGGERAPVNREWLRSKGATVPQQSVSAYDYLSDMNRAGVFVDRVDLTITFGYCPSSYNSICSGMVDTNPKKSPYNSTNHRQYKWNPSNWLQHLNESLIGQDAASTNVIIGPAHQIDSIKQTFKSYPATVVRLYIPQSERGQPLFRIRMGSQCKFQDDMILMAHVSGPNGEAVQTHFVKTSSGEIQLDISSLIMTTLRHEGTVVSLASGECRLFDLLKHYFARPKWLKGCWGTPVLSSDANGCWGKKVIHPQFNIVPFRGYFDHVMNGPRETAACTPNGRVNLVSMGEWTQSNRPIWIQGQEAFVNKHAQQQRQKDRRTLVNDSVYKPY